MLDGRELVHLAVKMGRDLGIELLGALDATVQQRIVMGGIGLVKASQLAREQVDLGGAVAAQDVLVERLQRELT